MDKFSLDVMEEQLHFRPPGVLAHCPAGDDLALSYKNLVNCRPVTPEFTRVVCTFPSTISSGVSLITFVWRRHYWALRRLYLVLFHYYSLRGDTAMLGGLHGRLCHAFLVLDECRIRHINRPLPEMGVLDFLRLSPLTV